jgi:perosamine synthetase
MIHVSQPTLTNHEFDFVRECFVNNQLSGGPMVRRFEDAFAERVGRRYAVACTSGTTALHLAVECIPNLAPGDEVVVPALTYVSTATAVLYAGATVKLADVGLNGCLQGFARTSRTRAVIPVHLYGVPAPTDHRGLFVIEDAAQALGGSVQGRPLGSFADIACFSFFANKVLAIGEGGMVVTDNESHYNRLKHLRGMAQTNARYYHDEVGFNYRMTDLQAAVGLGQLAHLDEMLAARSRVMRRYQDNLINEIHYAIGAFNAPWLFTCLLPPGSSRPFVMEQLAARGIETRPTFVPLNRLPMFQGSDEYFPNACMWGDRGLSLPTWPGLELSTVDMICQELLKWI